MPWSLFYLLTLNQYDLLLSLQHFVRKAKYRENIVVKTQQQKAGKSDIKMLVKQYLIAHLTHFS